MGGFISLFSLYENVRRRGGSRTAPTMDIFMKLTVQSQILRQFSFVNRPYDEFTSFVVIKRS
ncbi:MAG: hypothetical protein C4527_08565 [Candidatus Omnitrophota bacterium]|nr:MAG: hypothetical protein C4527_08565 [Candidatus Omnitrophota bacterium]